VTWPSDWESKGAPPTAEPAAYPSSSALVLPALSPIRASGSHARSPWYTAAGTRHMSRKRARSPGEPGPPSEPEIRQLELEMWREAGRHLRLHDSLSRMLPLLARRLPVRALAIRRLDLVRARLETIAREGAPPR